MPIITPEVMSAWLKLQPEASSSGLHTKVAAALWDIRVPAGGAWEGTTQRSTASHVLWFVIKPFFLEYEVDGRAMWSGPVERHASHLLRAGECARGIFHGSGQVLHLYIPHELLAEVSEDFGHPAFELVDPCLRVEPDLTPIENIITNLIAKKDRLAQLEMDHVGIMACARLLRCWSTRQPASAMKGRLGAWQVKRAITFLMDHLQEDISLSDVASHVGLSQFHFNRAFKRSVGVSPHRYLLLKRIEKAKELLAHGTLSITEIAERVGYTDPNQLARAFRKEVLTTPSEYRRRHRRRP